MAQARRMTSVTLVIPCGPPKNSMLLSCTGLHVHQHSTVFMQYTQYTPASRAKPDCTSVPYVTVHRLLSSILFDNYSTCLLLPQPTVYSLQSCGLAMLKLFMLLVSASSEATSSSIVSCGTTLYCAAAGACSCCFPRSAAARKRRHRLTASMHHGVCVSIMRTESAMICGRLKAL